MSSASWLKKQFDPLFLIIALIHWGITLFLEEKFYQPHVIDAPVNMLQKLIVIAGFWQIIAYMICRYRQDENYRTYLHFVLFSFAFSFLFLLLIWPGNWAWDDLLVLDSISNNEFYIWHHFLTRIFFQIALFLLPTPVSVLLLQLAVISLISGYCIYTLYCVMGKSKLAYLAYMPFMLPMVLIMNNTAIRSTLFAYLVLFLTVYILFNRWQGQPLPMAKIILLCFITGIITTLRGEGITYLLFATLLFLCAFWKQTTRKKKFIYLLGIYSFFLLISTTQNSLFGARDKARYQLILYLSPLYALIDLAHQNDHEDLVSQVNQFIDIQSYANIKQAKANFFNGNLIREAYYQEGAPKQLSKTYLELIRLYPSDFLQNRWYIFIDTVYPYVANTQIGLDSFYEKNPIHAHMIYTSNFERSFFSNYLSQNLRAKVLSSLAANPNKFLFYLITNLILPLLLLAATALIALLFRKYIAALAIQSILIMIIPIFLAAPDSLFMYYFTFYLNGYVVTTITILLIFHQIIKKLKLLYCTKHRF